VVGFAVSAVVVGANTICDNGPELLPAKLVSPLYVAVSECEPAASVVVVKVATPAPLSVTVPIGVPPSVKVTVLPRRH
jgi:hypothetical protein